MSGLSGNPVQVLAWVVGGVVLGGYFLVKKVDKNAEEFKRKYPERQRRAEDLKQDAESRNQGLMNILKATSKGTDVTAAVELEKQKLKIEQEKARLREQHKSMLDAHKSMLEGRASVKEE